MRITTGKVRHGAIDLEGEVLPDGSTVMVLAADGDETFELGPADEARLAQAIEEAERGATVNVSEVMAKIPRP